MSRPTPLLLCILDGWGMSDEVAHNAIAQAHTPNWDRLTDQYPMSKLQTSGLAVGLPEGQMGNSEVGHMTIGTGRIIMQHLPRINRAIKEGTLESHPLLKDSINQLQASDSAIHIIGLLSDGGVHAHMEHMIALATLYLDAGIYVYIHAILDGRDTPPQSALSFIETMNLSLKAYENWSYATLGGRYYGMDRDNNYDRIQYAYDAISHAKAEAYETIEEAVAANYAENITDEFILPAIIDGYSGIEEGDGVVFANFRSDRARQLIHALLDTSLTEISRETLPSLSHALGMVEYSDEITVFLPALFPSESVEDGFASIIAKAGLSQLRIAETEKYAHVTFFFNAGKEEPYPKEERILVPSPAVTTYDLQPEMSAIEVTDKVVGAINSGAFDVIILNFANSDMVGHTGIMEAAIKAVETIDHSLGRIYEAIIAAKGAMIVTADHGNVECMENEGLPYTSHTMGPVPFLLIQEGKESIHLRDGTLADIAPTMLTLLQLPKVSAMTGQSLIEPTSL